MPDIPGPRKHTQHRKGERVRVKDIRIGNKKYKVWKVYCKVCGEYYKNDTEEIK